MIQNESKRKAGKKNGPNLPKFTMKRLEVNCFLLSQNKGNCGLNTNLLKFIITQRPTQSISQIQYQMLLFFRPILKIENFDLMILVQRTFFRISSHHFDKEGHRPWKFSCFTTEEANYNFLHHCFNRDVFILCSQLLDVQSPLPLL